MFVAPSSMDLHGPQIAYPIPSSYASIETDLYWAPKDPFDPNMHRQKRLVARARSAILACFPAARSHEDTLRLWLEARDLGHLRQIILSLIQI